MTTRALKTTVLVGGEIAASLPTATRKAIAELERLRGAQRANQVQANRLRREIKSLEQSNRGGTEAAAALREQLATLQSEMGMLSGQIDETALAARGGQGSVQSFAGSLTSIVRGAGPVGIAIGAITGGVLALVNVLNSAGREAQDLIQVSTNTGQSLEAIQRNAGVFDPYTAGAEEAIKTSTAFSANLADLRRELTGLNQGAALTELAQAGLNRDIFNTDNAAELIGRLAEVRRGLDATGLAELDTFISGRFGQEVLQGVVSVSNDETGQVLQGLRDNSRNADVRSDAELRSRADASERVESLQDTLRELIRNIADLLIPAIGFLTGLIEKIPGVTSDRERRAEIPNLTSRRATILQQLQESATDVAREPEGSLRRAAQEELDILQGEYADLNRQIAAAEASRLDITGDIRGRLAEPSVGDPSRASSPLPDVESLPTTFGSPQPLAGATVNVTIYEAADPEGVVQAIENRVTAETNARAR